MSRLSHSKFALIILGALISIYSGLVTTGCSVNEGPANSEIPSTHGICVAASDCDPWEICDAGTCILAEEESTETPIDNDDGVLVEAKIETPITETAIQNGSETLFRARVATQEGAPGDLTLIWESDVAGILEVSIDDGLGVAEFSQSLGQGHHVITFKVLSSEGVLAEDEVSVYVCGEDVMQFDEPLVDEAWYTTTNDSSWVGRELWHEGGYLEMTNNTSQHGAAFKIDSQVNPGNLHLSFSISCGKCVEPGECNNYGDGADGFAMSIVAAGTPDELIELVDNHTGAGGGMGYVFGNDDNGEPPPLVEALHLEFDTYYNWMPAHGHQDPTQEDHVQVHVNGNQIGDLDPDPDNEVSLWAPIPDLEDNLWHDITVDIVDSHITVTLDGEVVIDGNVPNFHFKGGFLGFTAAAGAVFNYQRIDNIELPQQCGYVPPRED